MKEREIFPAALDRFPDTASWLCQGFYDLDACIA
jgi:hypothetical protein